ncbi:MAG: glycosyltransferase family 39 protein [Planctomycetes bacterium]|nr:glycosyltransferase family 39 protein [Planctomycetota bacterium]
MNKQTKLILFILFGLALIVRLAIALNTYVISSDGPLYIEAASYYYNGQFKEAISHPYHPVYPFLMSLAYRLIGNWEWAGMLVSILLSSLAVIPLYLIAIKLFTSKAIAVISSLFYIFHQELARLSSAVLTTGTFIFLLTGSVYLFIASREETNMTRKRYLFLALTGVFTMLSFLTRPDGIVLLFIFVAWIVFLDFRLWWKGGLKKKALSLLFITLPWLLAAIPYIIYMIRKSGEFTISGKLSFDNIAKMANPVIKLQSIYITIADFFGASGIFLALIIAGWLVRKGHIKDGFNKINIWIILSVFIVYFIVLIKFADFALRISKRYTTPLIPLIIFWGAIGLYVIANKISRRGLIASVLVVIGMFIPFTFKPVNKDKLSEREVGEWIKYNHKGIAQPLIVADSNRIPYYSGSRIIEHYTQSRLRLNGTNYSDLMENLRCIKHKADYLVIDTSDIDIIIPDFRSKLNPSDLEEINIFHYGNTSMVVYRVK